MTTHVPAFDFGFEVYAGETESVEADGFTFTATIHADDDATPPWEREDGHGPVSDWRRAGYSGHAPKSPGERPLCEDHASVRFYDFAEACKIALRDGWGVEGGRKEGETARAYAARAAESDFKRLRKWCADQWSYVGVLVTVEFKGVELVSEYEHALWGIESDAGEYVAKVAAELAEEALESARAKLAELNY